MKIEDVILFQLDKTSKTAKQYSQKEFDKLKMGITVEQWILLKIINETNTLSQKELAEKSLRDPSSITRTLDILVKKTFVARLPVPHNRRTYNIVLTKIGAEFIKKHIVIVEKHREKSIAGFSDSELKNLKSFLNRIENNMK